MEKALEDGRTFDSAGRVIYEKSMPMILFKSLFSISVKTENEMNKTFDSFNGEQYLLFNSTLLPLTGIGDDHFFLNEHLGEKTLLDFETLYDYDYDEAM